MEGSQIGITLEFSWLEDFELWTFSTRLDRVEFTDTFISHRASVPQVTSGSQMSIETFPAHFVRSKSNSGLDDRVSGPIHFRSSKLHSAPRSVLPPIRRHPSILRPFALALSVSICSLITCPSLPSTPPLLTLFPLKP